MPLAELARQLEWVESTGLGAFFAFLLGLIWGSFINVVIYRVPLGKSVFFPRSRCPACGEAIASYDNIPVLSYLLLRGRCRRCESFVSPRYPAVELLVGFASLLAFLRQGAGLEYVVEFAFLAAMVALMFIDFDHRILPDVITLPGAVVGLLLSGVRDSLVFRDAAAGALLGAGLLLLVSRAYYYIRGIEGLGQGDIKMMAMVGAFVGWRGVLLTLFLGSFLGSLVGLVVMRVYGGDLQTKLPFGTFLGFAAILTFLWGPRVIAWYSGFF